MPDTLSFRSFYVVIDAPAEVLFDFVSDLHNLPRWSIHFCRSIRVIADGDAMVDSPSGEVYFGITSNRDLGVLDWWSGPTMESAQRWPTRVVGLPDGRSLYQVTAILSGTDGEMAKLDPLFADELGMLKRLVEDQTLAV